MAGLFPKNGVSAGSAINANDPDVTEGCEPLFYANKCNTKFDAAQANAVMSELLGGINVMKSYECDRTDNLRRTFELLRNMCMQTTRPFNGPSNSYFAGCFDGHTGKIPVDAFIDGLITPPGEGYSICSLPVKEEMNSEDTVGACTSQLDKQIPAPILSQFFNAGKKMGPSSFLIGEYMGSFSDFLLTATQAFIPVSDLDVFFIHDLRTPTGGQNSRDPTPFDLGGRSRAQFFSISNSNSDRDLERIWKYGQIYPCFRAQNHQTTSPTHAFYLMNSSGACIQVPNSTGTSIMMSSASDPIHFYRGTILD